jgi:c-di-GMP-related signal transduction protein
MFVQSDGYYFRKPKVIRERWLSHLNPELKKY